MRLFDVGNGKQVRLTSGTVRWAELGGEIQMLGREVTWEGWTTGSWWLAFGVERRLLIDHTLEWHRDSGIWQRDIDCEVI